jgi:uncharacterized protein
MTKYFSAIIVGSLGGSLFQLINIPLPWTLGPLTFVAVAQLYFKMDLNWPSRLRNWGLVLLGYTMGRTFTPETGMRIFYLLPLLLLVTVLTLGLCMLGGVITKHFTGISLPTGLFGSLPAGLSQTVVISEELANTDPSVVALMQTVRVISVVFCIPFISIQWSSGTLNPVAPVLKNFEQGNILKLVGCFLIISCLVYLGKFIKIPGRYIIIPILGTAAIALSGFNPPELPKWILAIAQLSIGIKIGTSINLTGLTNWKKISFYSLLNVLSLLAMLLVIDYIISEFSTLSFLTLFIGTAPGGMAEMGLTAMMVQADLPTVVAFQLFRVLCMFIIVIPALSWWFKRKAIIKSQN